MLMQKMRESTKVVIYIVIVAFVATIFFAWGMDLSSNWNTKDAVGKINGRKIAYGEFKTAMERNYRQMVAQKEQGSEGDAAWSTAVRQTWEQFISQELMQNEFTRLGIAATGDQVYDYFKKNPPPEFRNIDFFKGADSLFDTTKYYQFLNTPQYLADPAMQAMEEQARSFMVPLKTFQSLISATALANDLEAEREVAESEEKAQFEFVRLPLAAVSLDSQAVSEKDIAQYYKAHSDSFKTKGKADLAFVRLAKAPSPQDDNRIRQDLLEIKKRVESGQETFAEAAQNESEDEGSSERGGDLGWFGRGAMVKEFETAVFSMQKGQISDPVRTNYGWHILQLEDKRKTGSQDEVKARHILIKVAASLETLDSLREAADSIQVLAKQGMGLSAAAAKLGLSTMTTGLYERGTAPMGIGGASGLGAFVAESPVGSVSDVLENEQGYYVCQIQKQIPAGVLPLEECRPTIRAELEKEKKSRKAEEMLLALTANTLSGAKPPFEYGKSDTVPRNGNVPALGSSSPVMYRAFAAKPGELGKPFTEGDASYLVRTLYKAASDPAKIAQGKDAALGQIAQRKQYQAYYGWYNAERNKSSIEEKLDEFFQF